MWNQILKQLRMLCYSPRHATLQELLPVHVLGTIASDIFEWVDWPPPTEQIENWSGDQPLPCSCPQERMLLQVCFFFHPESWCHHRQNFGIFIVQIKLDLITSATRTATLAHCAEVIDNHASNYQTKLSANPELSGAKPNRSSELGT